MTTIITSVPNPHDNDQHDPDYVAKTGDTMTGTLYLDNQTLSGVGGIKLHVGGNRYLYLTPWSVGSAEKVEISSAKVFFPVQAATITAPAYVKGGMYFNTTLNKLMIGGATDWETVTSG